MRDRNREVKRGEVKGEDAEGERRKCERYKEGKEGDRLSTSVNAIC